MSASASARGRNQRLSPRFHESSVFRIISLSLFAAVAVSLAIAAAIRNEPFEASLGELAIWTGVVALSSLVPLSSEGGPALAMDLPVLLGAGFVHGPVFAGIVGLVGAQDIRELRREVSVPRALLNRAQISLSAIAAAATFQLLHAQLGVWPWAALAALLALGADCVTNYTLVAGATSILTGRPFVRVIQAMRLGSLTAFLPLYVCFGFLGVLLAETYERLGIAGVCAFVAPVVIARQMFLQWRRADDARTSLEARNDALRRVDERIAEERRDERFRIASALHDDVLQCLYNVTIRTHVIKEDLRQGRLLDLDDDLPGLLEASERAVEELREVIGGLRKSAVGRAGLVETLGLLLSHLRGESRVRLVEDLDSSIHCEPDVELVVYQIAREALTNCLKHARASTVWVNLDQDADGLSLVVADDGVGFDPAGRHDSRHFGLQLMHERARSVGASLVVKSFAGSGTTLTLRVPLLAVGSAPSSRKKK